MPELSRTTPGFNQIARLSGDSARSLRGSLRAAPATSTRRRTRLVAGPLRSLLAVSADCAKGAAASSARIVTAARAWNGIRPEDCIRPRVGDDDYVVKSVDGE